MSGKTNHSRGNKNDRIHVAQRRALVEKIIQDMMDEGIMPMGNKSLLRRLDMFGFKTSMRTLERDIKWILKNNGGAIVSRHMYGKKVDPGTYVKLADDDRDEEIANSLFRRHISQKAALKARRQKIVSILAMMDSTLNSSNDVPS